MNLSCQNNRITNKMHQQINERSTQKRFASTNRRLVTVSLLSLTVLLTGCESVPNAQSPVTVEERGPARTANRDADIATPIPSDDHLRNSNIERAEYFERLAQNSNAARDGATNLSENETDSNAELGEVDINPQLTAALNAAEYYIQGNDFTRAQQSLNNHLNRQLNSQMSTAQTHRISVIRAYIAYSQRNYSGALATLNSVLASISTQYQPLESSFEPNLSNNIQPLNARNLRSSYGQPKLTLQQIDALLLSSLCHQELGNYDTAIADLLQRESALKSTARAETTRYIWQVIEKLTIDQRLALIDNTPNPRVRNRLEQSLEGQVGYQTAAPPQFSQWREQSQVTSTDIVDPQWNHGSAKHIAVLLPLSSRFAKASQALMDGIKYAHQQNTSVIAPRISFYDVGDNPFQVASHYNAAINNGADFVVGPLGKAYANQLNRYLYSSTLNRTPTVLLGGDTELRDATYRFTLSPESNGVRVARKAYQDGHLSAALLLTNSNNDQRVADAFAREWLKLGGKISKTVNYATTKFDHSAELKLLFGIYESEARQSRLRNTLGYRPKFSAYKRPDIDFVFMLADNEFGRIVRPQINFFSDATTPVYAASSIFNGIQNKPENLDLERTQFPVMPWVLRSANIAPYAGQLNQLYALGADTYKLAGNYRQLKQDPAKAINGNTGQININHDGVIDFRPVWASFVEGEAVAVDALGIDVNPLQRAGNDLELLEINPVGRRRNNSKASYNDSNWDPRESGGKISR